MKYRIAVRDKDLFGDYIYEEHDYLSLAEFDYDKDKDKICDLLIKQFLRRYPGYSEKDGILKWFYASAIDEEGVVSLIDYRRRRFSECGIMPYKNFRRAVLSQNKELKEFDDKEKLIKSKFDEDTIKNRISFFPGYKSFSFFDAKEGIEIPCRLKKCKGGGKRPLLVYLHGAGCTGHDNVRPLMEYMSVGISLKEDCFVLIPQCDNFREDNLRTIDVFTRSIRKLVEKLAKTYPIDLDRIYVTGISYGSACTWYSLYNAPGFYAAAIPLMGYFPESDSDTFDTSVFKDEKIWAGHASDDRVVTPGSDMSTYDKLKGACDIRFSLYMTGGHKMMKKFYRKEEWQKWLFSQKKSAKD